VIGRLQAQGLGDMRSLIGWSLLFLILFSSSCAATFYPAKSVDQCQRFQSPTPFLPQHYLYPFSRLNFAHRGKFYLGGARGIGPTAVVDTECYGHSNTDSVTLLTM
jgi:hypothetical protein